MRKPVFGVSDQVLHKWAVQSHKMVRSVGKCDEVIKDSAPPKKKKRTRIGKCDGYKIKCANVFFIFAMVC